MTLRGFPVDPSWMAIASPVARASRPSDDQANPGVATVKSNLPDAVSKTEPGPRRLSTPAMIRPSGDHLVSTTSMLMWSTLFSSSPEAVAMNCSVPSELPVISLLLSGDQQSIMDPENWTTR
jgi:hypothetical protein